MESHFDLDTYRRCIAEGLRVLGVDNLFLQIHDPSFPSFDDEETGRGSPYTRGGARFLERVRNVGFNGLQLGPQGVTSPSNPSPYDGTLFSRNPLSISLAALRDQGWLNSEQLDAWLSQRPAGRERVHYRFACQVTEQALNAAYGTFCRQREQGDGAAIRQAERLDRFRAANADWLERDGLYAVLSAAHGGRDWPHWVDAAGQPRPDQRLWDPRPGKESAMRARREELAERHASMLERYAFAQWLAHAQHEGLREQCVELGLKVYADLQIGMAEQDVWAYQALFLRGYRLGAPASRTNPDGQPWGFRVLDPQQYYGADGCPGPVARFVDARLRKVRAEYDGLRVDHPQGWVCPWVYRTDIPDPYEAVQNGARLFSSPAVADHPRLNAFALVTPEQLNQDLPRHVDRWVRALSEEQVSRYATLFAHLARLEGGGEHDVMCEVLSTMPYPLQRVLERYGLGRFRVLQNADPNDPRDVYRSDNARPPDWIMLGNHDTRPIWHVARRWCQDGKARDRAADLSRRLVPEGRDRAAWVERVASQPGELVHALFADMLLSQARNIMVFVVDMLGIEERYNTPGTVSDSNWSLRVPPDFESFYLSRVAAGNALSLPYALWLALRARPGEVGADLVTAMAGEMERLRAIGRAVGEKWSESG